ncbi:MAG: aminotransferase class V-fold PLP-dependent enzyme [Thermomicrobiaceae bacterium]
MSIEELLGVRPVINGAGPLTRLGGMPLAPEVAQAMADAGSENARIEDVQTAAGRYLAEVCGAEAGYVTAGAAAGLTVGAAACMAGLSPAAMDQLPDTTGLRSEIIIQRAHVTAYSHALRVSGAKLVDVGYVGYPGQGITWPWQVESAITERTAALFYSVGNTGGIVELSDLVEIGRKHGIPVIVDAAAALPPKHNLKRFTEQGADLVTFSGGKAIGGPQASGILVGRKDLIESVALQHQDMDIYPDTWTFRNEYLESGRLPGPPHHGLGRPMKVGKEEIAGLVVALKRFLVADESADLRRQREVLLTIADYLSATGAGVTLEDPSESGRAVPMLVIRPRISGDPRAEIATMVNHLIEGDPPVAVSQGMMDQGAIAVLANAMKSEHAQVAGARIAEVIEAREERSTT